MWHERLARARLMPPIALVLRKIFAIFDRLASLPSFIAIGSCLWQHRVFVSFLEWCLALLDLIYARRVATDLDCFVHAGFC